MSGRFCVLSLLALLGAGLRLPGQDAPPGDNKPLLRLEAGGPTSNVTALAFSPDGDTLYAAGFDKVVRIWERNPKTGLFELDVKRYFRVPINPGTEGAINAMALSSDGEWLAVGGQGVVRVAAGFFDTGRVWPTVGLKPELRTDQGLIYVYSTKRQEVRLLRGHTGPVVSLSFAAAQAEKPPYLVSAAQGWDSDRMKARGEVRVWDVAKAISISELTSLPALRVSDGLPGLAAISTGPKATQMKIAISWGDIHKGAEGMHGYLRLWDLSEPNDKVKSLYDGYYNTALSTMPDPSTILSGSFLNRQGKLRVWDLTSDPPTVKSQVALTTGKSYFFPKQLALLSVEAKAVPDHAAVLIRHQELNGEEKANRLHIVDLRTASFGRTRVQTPLWKNNGIEPVLAVSSGGRYLAVAGNQQHSIHIYSIEDLLQNRIEPQVLHSVGATMKYVAFATRVDKGKSRLGLALSENSHQDDGLGKSDLVFDFEERNLTAKIQGWKVARPDTDGWSITRAREGGRETVQVFKGDQLVRRLDLPAEQRLDAVTLVPARAPATSPSLIVASYVQGRALPIIEAFQVQTGKSFRRYTGHSAPITSLAVSPDGRLLVSAANDQTVAVWSLQDIGEILDRQGGLAGVAVEKRGQLLVVAQVDQDSPAQGKLAPGMAIEGMIVGEGDLRPYKSAVAFYESFWAARPGDKLTIRVVDGKQKKDIALTVDQGVDQRTALFSLFFTRPDARDNREWLGWNAVGPFDSSGPAAERYVGWHFNTGQAKEPTKFAFIQQYRDEFYKKDILQHLIAEGSLPKALDKQKLPAPPRQPPAFGEPTGAMKGSNGDLLIRERKASLQLAIRGFAPEGQDTVEVQLGKGQPLPLAAPEGDLWSIPLDGLPAEAGRHPLRVIVRLHESDKRVVQHEKTMTIRYQPPAPQLRYSKASLYEIAGNKQFVFKAFLSASGEGPDVRVSLWLNDEARPMESWTAARGGKEKEISKKVTLREGANLIKVVAENGGALEGFEDEERSTMTVRVTFNPQAPSITFDRIEAAEGDDGPWRYEPDQTITVNVPRVRLVGTIQAEANLQSSEWSLGDKAARKKMAEFKQGVKTFQFTQEVELKPGSQRAHFFASTAKSQEGTESVALHYRPQLPKVVLTAPDTVIRTPGGKDTTDFTLEGKLLPPAVASSTPHEITASISVNGQAVGEKITLKSNDVALPPRKLALAPGMNQVKVTLAHAWGGSPSVAEFQTRYVRPPQVGEVTAKLVKDDPFVDIRADVQSALKPVADSIKVLVNGERQKFGQAEVIPAVGDTTGSKWSVSVKEIPLVLDENKKFTKNEITLAISNAEDQSAPSAPVTVEYKTPPPPRPEIALIAPSAATVRLNEPEMQLVFQVKSSKPLKRVEVSQAGRVLFTADNVDKLAPTSPGVYEFAPAKKLALQWGLNQLKIEAVNDGGPRHLEMIVTVPSRPVELSLDRLRTEGPKEKTFLPQDANGKRVFSQVPEGLMILEGKVRWTSKDDELLKKGHKIRIYVNGYQQIPVELGPAPSEARERPFKARLILNLPENHIEVEAPSLKQEASSRHECTMSCASPIRGQHLHVVLVAPDRKESKDLKDRMARALSATNVGPGLYKSRVFDLVHIYVFAGEVQLIDVESRLDIIRSRLKERASQGSPNDVLMFYYLGKETSDAQEQFLWMSNTRPGEKQPTNALALKERVSNYFSQLNGAQAVFLDIDSDASPAFKDEFRLAMIRHSQAAGPSRPQLLSELEAGMPQSVWLDQLPPILRNRLQAEHLHAYYPPTLKVQLNPDGSAPQK